MRKQTKLVAVLSAAALLAMGASMTSFAEWKKDDANIWHYYDSEGEQVTDEWRKDGGRWFYLNEEGDMATDQWVDEYYVGEDGHRLQNEWKYTLADGEESDDPDNEEAWFYFDSKGKMIQATSSAYKSKLIGGKTYYFDTEGKMQYGWVDVNGDHTKVVYCGAENDGARVNAQWRWLEAPNDDEKAGEAWHSECTIECDEEGWYYFKADGTMVANRTYKVNGKTYTFNADGQMLYEWVNTVDGKTATPATTAFIIDGQSEPESVNIGSMVYINEVEDGSLVKNSWVQVTGSQDVAGDNADVKWYYINGDGMALAAAKKDSNGNDLGQSSVRMNNGKKYYRAILKCKNTVQGNKKFCFDEKGQMKTGLQKVDGVFYYFDDNGYNKGGKISVTDDAGDTYSFLFDTKNSNKAVTGQKDNCLYIQGQRIEASDSYVVARDPKTSKLILIGKNGKIVKKGNGTKRYELDSVEGYVTVGSNGAVETWYSEKKDTDTTTSMDIATAIGTKVTLKTAEFKWNG